MNKKKTREQFLLDMRTKNKNRFLSNAKIKHGNKFDYSLMDYINNSTDICIVCPIHGESMQRPDKHLLGYGCKYCYNDDRKKSLDQFISEAHIIHHNKFDYSSVKYVNGTTKVWITCPIHGDFEQSPASHLQGYGCKECANDNLVKSLDDFILEASSIHGIYTYNNSIYVGIHDKLWITCPIHGDFEQSPASHLQGAGCPNCAHRGYSIEATEWIETVELLEGIYIQHATIELGKGNEFKIPGTTFTVDGYCADNNTVYEYHGSHTHGNPRKYQPDDLVWPNMKPADELYQKTKERENAIVDLGYNLIVMWDDGVTYKYINGVLEE